MDIIYFLARYTPFWAVPVMMISLEFSYLFWLRKKKKQMLLFVALFSISFISSVLYYIAGGPEKSVQALMKIVWFYTL
jgi:hypothetical protein